MGGPTIRDFELPFFFSSKEMRDERKGEEEYQ
jgi:hypothetical protein